MRLALYPRGIPIIRKDRGCSSGILERNSKRNQDPVLCAWLEMFLAPKKDIPILKQHIISSLFSAYALKGSAISSFHCEPKHSVPKSRFYPVRSIIVPPGAVPLWRNVS